ncbi:MAG TPA: LpqB family beta-propeller domain-containing protein [Micromonospora sp.]
MTRRRFTAVAVAVALAGTAVAGCGIPDRTGVQVDGRGPSPFSPGSNFGGGPPGRLESSGDSKLFVENFLKAAAGESAGAVDRVKKFIAPNAPELRDKPGIEVPVNVVRVTRNDIDVKYVPSDRQDKFKYDVTIKVEQVGVLRPDGSLGPPVATADQYSFTIGIHQSAGAGKPDPGLFVLDPPNVLLMSTDALDAYYTARTIYFWNADYTALVPDVRYLPTAVPPESRATEVLGRWLPAGPTDWLKSTAVAFPGDAKLIGNIPQQDDRVEVNLSAIATDNLDRALDLMATQMAWSMQELRGELDIKIQNQSRRKVNLEAQRAAHPIDQVTGVPQQFCVYAGALRPLIPPAVKTPSGGRAIPPVPLAADVNHDIVTAALARYGERVAAALVVAAGPRRDRRALRVGVGVAEVGELRTGRNVFQSISRPVWLRSADPQKPMGLVVADGRLYRFDTDAGLVEVKVPDVTGRITAVSVALDGHRMAFIAQDRLYVAALSVVGGSVIAGPPRQLGTPMSQLSAVEWIAERWLAVAGVGSEDGAIYQISVDGTVEEVLARDLDRTVRVTSITAFPGSHNPGPGNGRLMFESDGAAWDFPRIDRPIGRDEVAGLPEPPGAGTPTSPIFFY